MCRKKNCSSSKRMFQVRWRPIREQRPGRVESRRRTLCFARWKCSRRRKRKVARCALLIPAISKSQPRRWRWLPFTRAALRELHWHPNADEWQYYIGGKGRMTVVDTGNKARTMDFQEGDVGYVQKTLLHYVENTGDTDLVFLEMFGKVDRFQDLSFSEWLAHTPPEAVMAHSDASTREPSMRFPRTAAWSCRCEGSAVWVASRSATALPKSRARCANKC